MTTTARLHISGLTPVITKDDLKTRFSTFGEVKDVDGVGKLDGLGEPRKFAYVTLEATKDKLARCMNLLSGSTWKGAKLRVGQAKPDYRARRELELNPPPRPKLDPLALRRARIKRRLKARRLMRGTQGKEAKDMDVVTLENVQARKCWRRTPLGHLIRPLRMRPLHPIPLPPKRTITSKSKSKKLKPAKRKKFELRRAGYTVIDPARYGAVHLKAGMGGIGEELLGGGEVEVHHDLRVEKSTEMQEVEVASTISSSSEPKPALVLDPIVRDPTPALPSSPSPPPPTKPRILPIPPSTAQPELSLAAEKASTLALLGGLFSGDEWGGRESISGDEVAVKEGGEEGEEVGYEVAPRETDEERVDGTTIEVENEEVDVDVEADDLEDEDLESGQQEEVEGSESDEDEPTATTTETQHYTALKDMFKPQEETAGFSLGLDIELDPDAESFLPASVHPQPTSEPTIVPVSIQTMNQKHTIEYTPDPREMMFFPGTGKKDVFSIIEEKGWRWEHPGTSEVIRAKWDESKLELTREYKRRHRDAARKQRRGGAARKEEA